MRFNLLLRIAGCRSQSLFNGFKSIDTESVGIPNLFCSSIDNFVTGESSSGISPDKIFRIRSRCSRRFLFNAIRTMFTGRSVLVKV